MSGLDALQSVQFVTQRGKRLAVLSAEDWEALIERLETHEDVQVARQAFAELKAAKGNRRRAGWLEWNSVKRTGLSRYCVHNTLPSSQVTLPFGLAAGGG